MTRSADAQGDAHSADAQGDAHSADAQGRLTGKTRRVYGRPGDEIPPARSTVYDPPRIVVPTRASGGMVRGEDGKFSDVIAGMDGELTCKEVERELVEIARENGVPADERNIRLTEVSNEDGYI